MLWVKERPRSGLRDSVPEIRMSKMHLVFRPITEKVGEILQLVEQDWHASCQEIAEALNINHMTAWNHLKKANYKKKLGVRVPHEWRQRNLNNRINISEMLLKRTEMEPFLKRIITGDEKWVKYENVKRNPLNIKHNPSNPNILCELWSNLLLQLSKPSHSYQRVLQFSWNISYYI